MDDSTAAALMRNLDEDLRNWLIDQAGDKVIDLRPVFEKRSLDGHVVTMPFPWLDGDDIA